MSHSQHMKEDSFMNQSSRKRRRNFSDDELSQPDRCASHSPAPGTSTQEISRKRNSLSPLTIPEEMCIEEYKELYGYNGNTHRHDKKEEPDQILNENTKKHTQVDSQQEDDTLEWYWDGSFFDNLDYSGYIPYEEEEEEKGIIDIQETPQEGKGVGQEKQSNKEINIRDLYTFATLEDENWKDAVEKKRYRVKFSKEMGQFSPENHELYAMAMMDMVSRIQSTDSSLKMGMAITPRGGQTLYVHPRPIDQYTTNFLEAEMEHVIQSGRELNAPGDEMEVTLTTLKGISGSGRRKGVFPIYKKLGEQPNIFCQTGGNVDLDTDIGDITETERRRGTYTNNVTAYCLGTAIGLGIDKIKLKEDPSDHNLVRKIGRWRNMRTDKQSVSADCWKDAKDILLNAGITKDRDFTIEDVRKVQRTLDGEYQLIVLNNDHDPQPVFTGKYVSRRRHIPLLYNKGHFELIFSLPRFVGCHFYCTVCFTKFPTEKRHYNCPLKCSKCLTDDCARTGNDSITCQDCGIFFSLKACYDNHKIQGLRGGKSRCSNTKICKKCKQSYYTDRGIKHECGTAYCQACRSRCEKGHTHTLAIKPPLTKYSHKRIFFDLETMEVNQDGQRKHQVVLACALRCCALCRDSMPSTREEALKIECDNCSPDGNRYKEVHCFEDRNKDVMAEFVEWLLQRDHKDFVVLAHNMKGFDGQLFLQQILRPHIPKPKNIIMCGRKINFIDICGMRMIDSFNFVPFALAKFSKAFSVPEITKGEFPFRFITEANFDYSGKMPDKEFYAYSEKNEDAKAKFDAFYDEKIAKGYVFNFKKDILDYCFSDVALLSAAMVKFEQGFLLKTKVVLFEESVTAAGAAITTFQRNFVRVKTMALDSDPSSTRIKQSAIARRYIAYRQTLENNNIQCADNIGEFMIPGTQFHVDGYIAPCSKYPRGKAIEFYGDYYHAHSCLYSANQIIRGVDRAIDIWKRDSDRETEIKKFCDLEIVWECEVLAEAQTNQKLADMLNQNLAHGPVVCREALFGGRTEVVRLYMDADPCRKLYYLDFTSLYPYVMKNCKYPVGEGRAILGSQIQCPITTVGELQAACQGYMSCKVIPPVGLFIPVLPYRTHKLLFTLCKTCGEKATTGVCTHTDEERALFGTWTTVELELAVSKGYIIEQIYGAVHWDTWTTDLFRNYINEFLREKQEASGWPAWVKDEKDRQRYLEDYEKMEGIKLDPTKIKKDDVTRQVSKLLLNSLWGKFGQRVDVTTTHIVTSATALYRLLNNPTIEITHVEIHNQDTITVQTRPIAGALQPLRTSCIQYAILTTSHARCTLYNALDKIPNPEQNLAYMDTDSIIFAADRAHGNPLEALTGEYLGQLTSELADGCEMSNFVTVGAKSYAYKQMDNDGGEKISVKAKGFSMNGDAESKIGYKLMRKQVEEVINNSSHRTEAVVRYHAIQRTAKHSLVNVEITKKFKFTFDKRQIVADGATLPFGYKRV